MLKSWREVARPHKDVLEGTFQQSEYLATVIGQKWGNPTALASKHVFADHKDVPDDITNGLRVVVLPLDPAYARASEDRTFETAKGYLDRHGTQPRMRSMP